MKTHSNHIKAIVSIKDDSSNDFSSEKLWLKPMEQGTFEIDSIPFFATDLAIGDTVSVRMQDGVCEIEGLINPSGNSTVQIIFNRDQDIEDYREMFKTRGCQTELFRSQRLLALNVPKSLSYEDIASILREGFNQGVFDYCEACLGFKVVSN